MCAVEGRFSCYAILPVSGERPAAQPAPSPFMLQKILALALGVAVVGHLFFKPQLRQLGRRIDRFVSVMVVAIVITWLGQLIYFLLTRR